MRIVAFYSFKGGVGRTTSLLNVAYWLAVRGRKVVLADWDLHAPGLSLMELMRNEAGDVPTAGVLDWLVPLRHESHEPQVERPSVSDLIVVPKLAISAQSRDDDPDPESEHPRMTGEILFIPAGDLSHGPASFANRIKAAGLSDLKSYFQNVDPADDRFVFKVFCEELRSAYLPWRQASSVGEPDYLLVDCRTGLTEVGDLLLGEATDFNVVVYAHDPQNLRGLEIALNARPRSPWELQQNTLLLWTLEPAGQEQLKVELRRHKRELINEIRKRDSLGMPEAFPEEFEIPYHPEMALTNEPIVHRFARCQLSQLFEKITARVEQKCHWTDEVIKALLDKDADGATQDAPDIKARIPGEFEQDLLYHSAVARIAMARPLASFLFEPPEFDLAGCSLADLSADWPPDMTIESQRLLANLIAWMPDLSTEIKNDFFKNRNHELFHKILPIACERRSTLLRESGVYYWGLLTASLARTLEWWLFGGSLRSRANAERDLVRPLLNGHALQSVPASHSAVFSVLVANCILLVLSDADDSSEWRLLRGWLRESRVDCSGCIKRLILGFLADTSSNQSPHLGVFLEDALNSIGTQMLIYSQSMSVPNVERLHWLSSTATLFRRAIESGCDWADTITCLGDVYSIHASAIEDGNDKGKLDERSALLFDAIQAYCRSLKLRPDDPLTLHNLGSAYDQLGQATDDNFQKLHWIDLAIASYESAINDRRKDADALYNLGCALLHRGQATEATDERARFFDKAIKSFKMSLDERPDDPYVIHKLGDAYDLRGRATEGFAEKAVFFDRAIESFQRLLEYRPKDIEGLHSLGAAYDERGRASESSEERMAYKEKAISAYNDSLAQDIAPAEIGRFDEEAEIRKMRERHRKTKTVSRWPLFSNFRSPF